MDALSSLKSILPQSFGGGVNSVAQDAVKSAHGQTISPADLAKLDATPALQPSSSPAAAGASFENMLGSFVGDVAQKQSTANDTIKALLSGQNVSLHQTTIAMEEANVSFQMMVEVRNKLLDSYQELMKMQV